MVFHLSDLLPPTLTLFQGERWIRKLSSGPLIILLFLKNLSKNDAILRNSKWEKATKFMAATGGAIFLAMPTSYAPKFHASVNSGTAGSLSDKEGNRPATVATGNRF